MILRTALYAQRTRSALARSEADANAALAAALQVPTWARPSTCMRPARVRRPRLGVACIGLVLALPVFFDWLMR